ncbi:MAG: 50S ribosomal protein L17 [Bacteroidetes bacterium]|nr:50S ribosomal protein L17 [Bacteroidota bacterium]
MRHGVKGRKLGRTSSHRKATLEALATSLFKHKKIKTTLAKAKTAKTFIEPLITKAKNDSVHARRLIASQINERKVVQELFNVIVPKIGDRPGGYLRVVKLGQRFGDAAQMAILELVDFNDVASKKKESAPKAKAKAEPKQKAEAKPKAAAKVKEEDVQDANVIEETAEVKTDENIEEKKEDSAEKENK